MKCWEGLLEQMVRVNKIINHEDYQKYLNKLKKLEQNRKFCRHDFSHFLDVARIASIINLRENSQIDPEQIYAAALLHDIGRAVENPKRQPHAVLSAQLSEKILLDCYFLELEIKSITDAIIGHGDKKFENAKNLCGILYMADKLSRQCYMCDMQKECFWSVEEKNLKLKI